MFQFLVLLLIVLKFSAGSNKTYADVIIGCRPEDGFHRCSNGSCVPRSKVKLCGDSTAIKCTDNEIRFSDGSCRKRVSIPTDGLWLLKCRENSEFECEISKKCIPKSWVNNGKYDCDQDRHSDVTDRSDENRTTTATSCDWEREFKCQPSNRCLSRELVIGDGESPACEGGIVTTSGGRPENRTALKCDPRREFRCPGNRRCIRRHRVVDGVPDCPRGEDERPGSIACDPDLEFRCGDRCIPRSWAGNSIADCPDSVDELISAIKCRPDEFRCRDNSRCLPNEFKCDGVSNCPDCSDELAPICPLPHMFRCRDRTRCVPWGQTMDQRGDCADWSDEATTWTLGFKCFGQSGQLVNVPQVLLGRNRSICTDQSDQCPGDTCFRCLDNATRVHRAQLCDDVIDCPDFSDECGCLGRGEQIEEICRVKFMMTSSPLNSCGVTSFCDGVEDCDGGVDELHCRRKKSYVCARFNLTGSAAAVVMGDFCDGQVDCPLKDDECSMTCRHPVHVRRRICFPDAEESTELYCDGRKDLPDGRDEEACPWRFQCRTNDSRISIHPLKYRDGVADCADQSDELSTWFPDVLDLSNKPNTTAVSFDEELLHRTVLKLFMWFTGVTSLLGNALVIQTTVSKLWGMPADRNGLVYCNNLLIANLAVSDMLMGVPLLMLAVQSHRYPGGHYHGDVDRAWRTSPMCTSIGVMTSSMTLLSGNMLSIITLIRLFILCRPFRVSLVTRGLVWRLVVLNWFVSVTFAFVPLMGGSNFTRKLWIAPNSFVSRDMIGMDELSSYTGRVKAMLGDIPEELDLTSAEARESLPEFYLEVRGKMGYYGAQATCFIDFFAVDQPALIYSRFIISYFLFGLCLLITSYAFIYKLSSKKNRCAKQTASRRRTVDNMKRKTRLIVLTNSLSWVPICVAAVMSYNHVPIPTVASTISAVVLMPISAALNPIIYSDIHCQIFSWCKALWNLKRRRINTDETV